MLILHLGVQIALAHVLDALQQRAEAAGNVEDDGQLTADNQEQQPSRPGENADEQQQKHPQPRHQGLPGQRQQPQKAVPGGPAAGEEPLHQTKAEGKDLLHQTDAPGQQPSGDKLPQNHQDLHGPGQEPDAEGVAQPEGAGGLCLGYHGEEEAHHNQAAEVRAPQAHGNAHLQAALKHILPEFRQEQDQTEDGCRGESQIQVKRRPVQASGPDLGLFGLVTGGTAQVDRGHGKDQDADAQNQEQLVAELP